MRMGVAALCAEGFPSSDHFVEGHSDHTLKVK